ncbi:hypothetical protein FRC11_010984, partial [Ceratobasidium sp. 423]
MSRDAYTPYNAQVDYNDWKNNFTDWFTNNAEKAKQSVMEIDNQEEEEHAVSTQHAVQTRSRVGKGKGKAREMKQARPMQPKHTHSGDQPECRLKRKGGQHVSFSTDAPGINSSENEASSSTTRTKRVTSGPKVLRKLTWQSAKVEKSM